MRRCRWPWRPSRPRVGLLSLCYSELTPIRLFGVFSAIGVVIGSLTQFTLLPAALAVWTPLPPQYRRHEGAVDASGSSQLTLFPRLGDWVTSHANLVAIGCLVVMLVTAAGLPKIRTSIQMMRLFSQRAPVIPMTRWLERTLGATIPLEVLLAILAGERHDDAVDGCDWWQPWTRSCGDCRKQAAAVSAATFAPREVTRSIPIRPVQKAVINAKLKQQYDVLHEYGWVARDGDDEIWRISLRIRGIDDVDYAEFTETLRSQVDPLLTKQLGEGHPGVEMTITGTAPIVFRARRSLLDGMLFGLGTDVVLIVVAVIVTTRSWLTGGVMLVLSVFPTALVFGAMGLLGIVVDIGSVMTPCVAVGVTVDDVIHFLLCHRRGVQQGLTVPQAANLAYRTCGRAMIQSWGIIGVGLSAFALEFVCAYVPFRHADVAVVDGGAVWQSALPAGAAGRPDRSLDRQGPLGAGVAGACLGDAGILTVPEASFSRSRCARFHSHREWSALWSAAISTFLRDFPAYVRIVT